jgi:hypothetical protein
MARIKIAEVVSELDTQLRSALASAVQEVFPEANVDRHQLFRAFKRAVARKCSTWETVSDSHVDT